MTTRTGHFWGLWILCLGSFSLWSHSIVWCCKNNKVYTDQLYNIDTQFAEKHKLDFRSFFSAHYQQKLLSKYQKNQLYQSCVMEISLTNKSNMQPSQFKCKAINQYCPKALLVISKTPGLRFWDPYQISFRTAALSPYYLGPRLSHRPCRESPIKVQDVM